MDPSNLGVAPGSGGSSSDGNGGRRRRLMASSPAGNSTSDGGGSGSPSAVHDHSRRRIHPEDSPTPSQVRPVLLRSPVRSQAAMDDDVLMLVSSGSGGGGSDSSCRGFSREGSSNLRQAQGAGPSNAQQGQQGPDHINGDLGVLSDFLPGDTVRGILVCLPAKAVLRFRAVSRDWRRLLTDGKFLIDHYDHQPLDAVVDSFHHAVVDGPGNQVLVKLVVQAVSLRTGEIREVIDSHSNITRNYDGEVSRVHACSDGIMLLRFFDGIYVCNPATHQRACLPRLQASEIAALYAFDEMNGGRDFHILYHRGQADHKLYYIVDLRALSSGGA
ncbi:unnamed protein product [Urochloa humidicola]